MKTLFIFIMSIVSSVGALCQSAMDTTYIATYPQKMLIRGIVSYNFIDIEDHNLHYKPNSPLSLGAGFSIKNTVVSLRTDVGLVEPGGQKRGKSRVFDFQVHRYGRHFLLDAFFQNYKGYYLEDKEKKITLYPDLAVRQIGLEGAYFFKGDKFSTRAAFDQSELQLRSAGSFVLGGGIYSYRLNLEKELLRSANNPLNNFQLGLNGGYAYSWVIDRHWLMSGSATAGINIGNDPELLKKGRIEVYPTGLGRGSVGYHKSDWAASLLVLVHNKSIYPVQANMLNLTSVSMEISFVKHFDRVFKKKGRGSS